MSYTKSASLFLKRFFQVTLLMLGITSGAFASQELPYEADITRTPDIHTLTHTIGMEDLKKHDYNLSRFHVTVRLKGDAVETFLKERLLKDLWRGIRQEDRDIYLGSEVLKTYVRTFLTIEAEAVFYRDLAHDMQSHHADLNNNEAYQKHLAANWRLFEGLLDVTAGKGGDLVDFLSRMIGLGGTRKVKSGGKEMYGFERILLQDKRFDPAQMMAQAQKVKEIL
ncbi:MAG: hypothetical protein C0514_06120 [Candidatus Puniceispirillum sp.]|nr:hypothetical protein [Candidatus Puniceispirillum sp.]